MEYNLQNFGEESANISGELFTRSEDEIDFKHGLSRTVFIVFAYAMVFVTGVVGNTVVIVVLLLRPQMKTITNMFILNLAVADLFVIFLCVVPTIFVSIWKPWILGAFICKTLGYAQGVSVFASGYSLVAISLERYLVICHSLRLNGGLSKFTARVIIVCIWIAALIVYCPWLFVFKISKREGQPYCNEQWDSKTNSMIYFIIGNLILSYTFPLFLVMCGNGLVWLHVSRRQVPGESALSETIERVHRKTRNGVLRMLTALSLTFLVSWLPLYSIYFWYKIGLTLPESVESIIPFAQWLGSFNSACNPILYAFLNKKFRENFHILISCSKAYYK